MAVKDHDHSLHSFDDWSSGKTKRPPNLPHPLDTEYTSHSEQQLFDDVIICDMLSYILVRTANIKNNTIHSVCNISCINIHVTSYNDNLYNARLDNKMFNTKSFGHHYAWEFNLPVESESNLSTNYSV